MKLFNIKFIKEEAITQSATKPADVSFTETQEQNDETAQQDNLVANVTPTLQEQDVDGLEDKDVMNYVYFNAPQDIDDNTRQALFNRADQIRQKQMNGATTPKDQEDFAKGVIAAASQTKNKATMGESLDYGVQAWIKALTGKSGKKGRDGSANWIGDDLYDEIEKDENGRIHYYNAWIGKVDRANKIIYINDEVAPRGTVHKLIQAAHLMTYKAKRTHETRELIDMGYEDDDFDPMYSESYSSGRLDGGDEFDIRNDLVNRVAYKLDDEFGYEVDKFDINTHSFVAQFLKSNPDVFKKILSRKSADNTFINSSDIHYVLQTIIPSFTKRITFLKKFGK